MSEYEKDDYGPLGGLLCLALALVVTLLI